MDFVRATNLDVPHGFTTRTGGVSASPYDSLNLGLSSGDAQAPVAENRRRVLAAFGKDERGACAFTQVHGTRVLEGKPSWFEEEADAVVGNTPGLLLVVSVADCLPVLFHDPVTGAVGAAHCGWRGTVAGIAAKTLSRLTELYGSRPEDVRVAFGPSISRCNYQVGAEVVKAFRQAGFPASIYGPDGDGKFLLDVAAANSWALREAGILPEHLWQSGLCTYAEPARFYSHRRDKGQTGRHWAVIQGAAP
jgi:YfiH family protein